MIEVEDWDKWMEDYEKRHGNGQAEKVAERLNGQKINAILDKTNDKEKADVHIVGKIDKNIYKCITEDIVTDEVIITDERIQHIKERHPNDYERFYSYILNCAKISVYKGKNALKSPLSGYSSEKCIC